jgi:hypothetical protein
MLPMGPMVWELTGVVWMLRRGNLVHGVVENLAEGVSERHDGLGFSNGVCVWGIETSPAEGKREKDRKQ